MGFDDLVKIYQDVKRCADKLSFLETIQTVDDDSKVIIKKIVSKAEEILTLCTRVLHESPHQDSQNS